MTDFPASTSGCQNRSAMTDDFPHLDIINDLLDDENGIPKATRANTSFHQSFSNAHHLNRQFSFPMDIGMSKDTGPTTSSSSLERERSYHDGFQRSYASFGGHFDSLGESFPQANSRPFVNGQIDGLIQSNQWQMGGSDLSYLSMSSADGYGPNGYPYYIPDYSNLSHGDNGRRLPKLVESETESETSARTMAAHGGGYVAVVLIWEAAAAASEGDGGGEPLPVTMIGYIDSGRKYRIGVLYGFIDADTHLIKAQVMRSFLIFLFYRVLGSFEAMKYDVGW
ncbi:hypothetical protein Vadar_030274 [Vaccinium darrowii]|uniref:Uncharacterized protein n=1 Tax=Vaccinium darrowii TaxID=229202 RepID=A0ACB7Z0K2_9ERIC|nr:hypothetical protein Vadar_030274 [Vaccinium darrowii]